MTYLFINSIFHRAKIFNFDKINLAVFFSWIFFVFYLEPHCQSTVRQTFPLFSSVSLIVLNFTLKSMTHFDFYIRYKVCVWVLLFLFSGIQWLQHHLLKKLSFLHWIKTVPLPKISRRYLCGSVSGFSFVPLVCMSHPFTNTMLSWLL